MNHTLSKTKRLLLPVLLVSALGGCVVYEPLPAGSYIANADGTRTYVQGTYTCPEGYTCSYPASQAGTATYAPAYYAYQPAYVAPDPYFWTPLFLFGAGYYLGHHHHGGYRGSYGGYRGGYRPPRR